MRVKSWLLRKTAGRENDYTATSVTSQEQNWNEGDACGVWHVEVCFKH